MWVDALEIAIIEQDVDTISNLLDNMMKIQDIQEAKRAFYLLEEASMLLKNLKDETSTSMRQMKKNINFLKSTQSPLANRLDIIS